MQTIYTGQLVKLRPFKSADEAVETWQEINVETNAHWGPAWHPLTHYKKDFEEHGLMNGENWHQFAVEELASGKVAGVEQCGLCGKNSIEGWFGTLLKPEFHRRGLGTEAKQLMMCFMFENFPVNRLMSDTVVHHIGARKGMEKCGLKLEGYLRACHIIDGQWYDLPWYRILRREWELLPFRGTVKRGESCPAGPAVAAAG